MTVVKGLLLGVVLSVIYSVVYLYYRMYQALRGNLPGTTLHFFEAPYWVGVVGMLLIGCAIVWYWSSDASMWIVNRHLINSGLIVKGVVLGVGLFLVSAVAYLFLWIRSVAPGFPVGTFSVDARTFTALTVNPLFWAAFLACVGIGCAIVWYWPGKIRS